MGFLDPITLFLILGVHGLALTPYFLYFHYFGPVIAHSHFSTSYTAHGLLFSLFPGSFKPIYLFKTHLFISWAYDPLFLPLGLNGFSIYLPTLFCLCCWASPFHLGFQNGHQHFVIWLTLKLCWKSILLFFFFNSLSWDILITFLLDVFVLIS